MILPEARAPLTYNYDAISRLTSISETQGSSTWTAATATYNSANLMSGLTYGPNGPQFSETRTYNNLLQLIRDTVTGGSSTLMDMQYVFPSGANNRKVSQTTDGVIGETVNYQYDALNRLIAATASNNSWGEAYSFDGFGNLQWKTPTVGSAPSGGGATSLEGIIYTSGRGKAAAIEGRVGSDGPARDSAGQLEQREFLIFPLR